MINLLEETIKCIEESGHTEKDIVFIGSEESGYQCSWEEFKIIANKEYDNGFGGQEVATDLIIVFSDGMKMWRGEYDGSEWWNFSSPFKKPNENKKIKDLISEDSSWVTLKEINEEEII